MKKEIKKPQKIFISILVAVFVIELIFIINIQTTGNSIISELGLSSIFKIKELDKTQTLTGTIETIIVDDFENKKSDYIYYLNSDGKK